MKIISEPPPDWWRPHQKFPESLIAKNIGIGSYDHGFDE
jgi:hypothetical protein